MIALFVGRFQPFHNGHLDAVKQIARKADKIIIGLGSSQEINTKDNPFSADERIKMIKAALKQDYHYEIFLIPDINDDGKWVEHVCKIVPQFDAAYTGNAHTKRLFEEKGFLVAELAFNLDVEGTMIRSMMAKNQDYSSLVPKGVLKILKEIRGEERVRKLWKS